MNSGGQRRRFGGLGKPLFTIQALTPIGWLSLVAGLEGLRRAREMPRLGGGRHALFAVIVGGGFATVWTLLTLGLCGLCSGFPW